MVRKKEQENEDSSEEVVDKILDDEKVEDMKKPSIDVEAWHHLGAQPDTQAHSGRNTRTG